MNRRARRSKNPFDSFFLRFSEFSGTRYGFSTREADLRGDLFHKIHSRHELFRSASARFATETPTDPSVLSIKKYFVCRCGWREGKTAQKEEKSLVIKIKRQIGRENIRGGSVCADGEQKVRVGPRKPKANKELAVICEIPIHQTC